MGFSSTITAVLTAALLVAAGIFGVAEGQNDCVSQLVTCADSLNSTNPSPECCKAIRQVVQTQLPCLCGLLNNPALLQGIDIKKALELPKHCNVSSDTSVCRASAPGPGSASLPPPASTGGGNGQNAAVRVSSSWIKMAALVFVLAVTSLY